MPKATDPNITRNPPTPNSGALPITPYTRSASPPRKRTAATTMRRRAWKRGSLARTAEANLGSSASDRSICSNSRCSCSESGTALLPGHRRPARTDRRDRCSRAAACLRVYERVSGSESGTLVPPCRFSVIRPLAGRRPTRHSRVFLPPKLPPGVMIYPCGRPGRAGFKRGPLDRGLRFAAPAGAPLGLPDQAGRTDGTRAEPGGRGIGGPLRLAPADLAFAQAELVRRRAGGGQSLHPDAHQPDPVARAQRL